MKDWSSSTAAKPTARGRSAKAARWSAQAGTLLESAPCKQETYSYDPERDMRTFLVSFRNLLGFSSF